MDYKKIQFPARTRDSLGRSKVKKSTRPDLQPRQIVDSDTADDTAGWYGRYSGGTHSRTSEFQAMHVSLYSIISCFNGGSSGSALAGRLSKIEDKGIVPLLVSRYELVTPNDFTEVSLPVLSVCRHCPLIASHSLVMLSKATARSLES